MPRRPRVQRPRPNHGAPSLELCGRGSMLGANCYSSRRPAARWPTVPGFGDSSCGCHVSRGRSGKELDLKTDRSVVCVLCGVIVLIECSTAIRCDRHGNATRARGSRDEAAGRRPWSNKTRTRNPEHKNLVLQPSSANGGADSRYLPTICPRPSPLRGSRGMTEGSSFVCGPASLTRSSVARAARTGRPRAGDAARAVAQSP